jgi:hypothetical protein
MFALNAAAEENACEPSRTLSQSPHSISPPLTISLVHGDAASSGPSACGAMCWRSTVEMRRNCGGWAGATPERASVL